MKHGTVAAALGLTAVLAAPTSSAAVRTGTALEGCGDSGIVAVHVDDDTGAVSSDNTVDGHSLQVRVRRPLVGPAVLEATVGLCTGSGAPAAVDVAWRLPSRDCSMHLRYTEDLTGTRGTTRTLREECGDPALPTVVSTLTLSDTEVTVGADAVRFRVPLARVPAVSQPRFAVGQLWRSVRAEIRGDVAVGRQGLLLMGRQVGVDANYDHVGAGDYTVEQPER